MSSANLTSINPDKYIDFLDQIKSDIQQTQLRTAVSITNELTQLYWRIGTALSKKVSEEKWGSKIIEKFANDISSLIPNSSGFSHRNLKFMRQFAESYPDGIRETAVSQIPWGHNIVLLQKLNNTKERLWYAEQTIVNGWSRNMLVNWIESGLYNRQGKAINNFKRTLPEIQSDLAEQTLKDPYNFSFLSLDTKYREQELEQGLIDHIQKFLMELGQGFAFIGRQYSLEVAGREYAIDLLFYHLKLRCYVVVELKATDFDPRDAGQMSFYLSAVDDLLRHPEDRPTIGMILCKTKDKIVVEYALRDNYKPIGVASYETKIMESLPDNLKGSLPTVEDIEAEFSPNELEQ
ncbi:PDDEXK nuclease domain-containing protein [Candidatus Protochlamydia phocaeensis]|uniref:PDDEXK nuclease domain-containing protein n=1 Tax=Candidatus Protochlamydia phocaeensis TaxID=1414722 RepID=UPI000837C952|nr:PDDEXK nuclease domain-containing protein [Candidatus Protochlamydia phocaeensis]